MGRVDTEKDLELALEVVTEGRKGLRRVAGDFTLEAADPGVADEAELVRYRSRDWVHGSGVQGLGIGDKLTHGEPTGELALRVYVEEEAEGNGRQSRAEGGGCPRGRRADNRRHRAGAGRPRAIHRAGPAGDAGLGLGHTDVTVGTFGCLVRRRAMRTASTC